MGGFSSMKWLDRLFGGPKDMAALPAGTKAPEINLPAIFNGKDEGKFSLQAALNQGPVLAAFFKVSCPTCQYAFPYLERIYKAHGGKKITIVGISQNDRSDTARSEEHTSELQSHSDLVCRLLLEKKKKNRLTLDCIYMKRSSSAFMILEVLVS